MSQLTKRIKRRLYLESKHLYQDLFTKNIKEKTIVFIVGCQRSGTTMLSEVFEGDMKIRVYSEFSKLSSTHQPRLRLNPLPILKKQIARNHPATVILKPLVESQNTDSLLDFFPNSKAIWAFRHYKDVAASNLKKFGLNNGIDDLKPIFEEDHDNWRAERISEETRSIIRKYYSENMSPKDAAALFWYVRNILFFERGFENGQQVYLCNYKDLVTAPIKSMEKIYEFIGIPYPEKTIVSEVHSGSVGKGTSFDLSPQIEALCEGLWERLNAAYEAQNVEIQKVSSQNQPVYSGRTSI